MYKKIISCTISIIVMYLLVGCVNNSKQKNENESVPTKETKLVGNDRDDHGCIGSAGYLWSVVLKDCIRPFEKGIRMKAIQEKESTLAAYLVFSPDQRQVELFLPKGKEHPILLRTTDTQTGNIWKGTGQTAYSVKQTKDGWQLYDKSELIYQSEGNSIPSTPEKTAKELAE